jgi:hypothetical protein
VQVIRPISSRRYSQQSTGGLKKLLNVHRTILPGARRRVMSRSQSYC